MTKSRARSLELAWAQKQYTSPRWRKIRAKQLRDHPLCAMCSEAGRVTAATVCDHIEPHRGDQARFWAGPFQSLCDAPPWRCHSARKQSIERLGYDAKATDADGWPSDPRHPANRR